MALLTPTEIARETYMERRDVIARCLDLGVPIFQGRIDLELFRRALAGASQESQWTGP